MWWVHLQCYIKKVCLLSITLFISFILSPLPKYWIWAISQMATAVKSKGFLEIFHLAFAVGQNINEIFYCQCCAFSAEIYTIRILTNEWIHLFRNQTNPNQSEEINYSNNTITQHGKLNGYSARAICRLLQDNSRPYWKPKTCTESTRGKEGEDGGVQTQEASIPRRKLQFWGR